ncbi:FecR family protein [Granulicella arctica]|uniref:FecR protein domain-containing protein n=1 Tax=Granulicella arctica TaxID=940613 RepID=A0A7Y9PL00_9BACT|nr:FecR family protein [Granulicella arctica]NYF81036.1 hypothetical protein [Granulicella arctica]
MADTTSPGRAARLTFAEGYVHIGRPDSAAGDPAQLNMPLVEGQTVVTGEDGQAEVEFEDGSIARVTPNSALTLAHLTVDGGGSYNTQLALVKGLAYFELRSAQKFAYTVDAGGDLISPAENTTFRVNIDEQPATIAVLDGTAHLERLGSYRTDVHAGETLRSDTSDGSRYFLTQEIAPDTWDAWNETRDQAAADAATAQTSARDGAEGSQGYGWSDLDANGSWYNVPGQGQVWQPSGGDDASFDPYDNGAWVWSPGLGYTWASSYSWGWTPFRCGSWSYWDTFGWGWSPNSYCGGFGFANYGGGYGYGGYVNIVLPPRGYPVHRPPTPGHGGIHPIVPVHGNPIVPRPAIPVSGQRRIAGVVATPIRPIGAEYTARGGSAVGSSLRNDYPVNQTTHAPILGVQPGQGIARPTYVQGFAAGQQPAAAQMTPRPGNSSQGTYVQRAPQASAPRPSAPRSAPPASHSSASAPAASHSSSNSKR